MLYNEAESVFEDAQRVLKGERLPQIDIVNYCTGKSMELGKQIHVGPGQYMLFAGPAGTGKTSFVDTHIVINPVLNYLAGLTESKPNVTYRVMERSAQLKIAKWICYLVFLKFKNQISVPIIKGWNNRKRDLTDEDVKQIKSVMPSFEAMSKHIDLQHGAKKSGEILEYAKAKALKHGILMTGKDDGVHFTGLGSEGRPVIVYNQVNEHGIPFVEIKGKARKIVIAKGGSKFIPKDEQDILTHVVDHVGKIPSEGNEKTTLDTYSNAIAELRDSDMYFLCDISQLNRLSDAKDRKDLHLKMGDVFGSSKFTQNIDIFLAIIDPTYHDLVTWNDYDIPSFRKRFRILQGIKTTWGESSFKIPMLFLGENGYFEELPDASVITPDFMREIDRKYNGFAPDPKQGLLYNDVIIKPSHKREPLAPF